MAAACPVRRAVVMPRASAAWIACGNAHYRKLFLVIAPPVGAPRIGLVQGRSRPRRCDVEFLNHGGHHPRRRERKGMLPLSRLEALGLLLHRPDPSALPRR